MAARNRLFLLVTPIALYFGASMTMDHFEGKGWHFFNTGKDITTSLGWMAKALQSKDAPALEKFYATDYSGSRLGLNSLEQAEDKDGVRKYRFRSDGAPAGRGDAIAEWGAYLDEFASIEEAGLHIHRLEKWDSPNELVASVRLE